MKLSLIIILSPLISVCGYSQNTDSTKCGLRLVSVSAFGGVSHYSPALIPADIFINKLTSIDQSILPASAASYLNTTSNADSYAGFELMLGLKNKKHLGFPVRISKNSRSMAEMFTFSENVFPHDTLFSKSTNNYLILDSVVTDHVSGKLQCKQVKLESGIMIFSKEGKRFRFSTGLLLGGSLNYRSKTMINYYQVFSTYYPDTTAFTRPIISSTYSRKDIYESAHRNRNSWSGYLIIPVRGEVRISKLRPGKHYLSVFSEGNIYSGYFFSPELGRLKTGSFNLMFGLQYSLK